MRSIFILGQKDAATLFIFLVWINDHNIVYMYCIIPFILNVSLHETRVLKIWVNYFSKNDFDMIRNF